MTQTLQGQSASEILAETGVMLKIISTHTLNSALMERGLIQERFYVAGNHVRSFKIAINVGTKYQFRFNNMNKFYLLTLLILLMLFARTGVAQDRSGSPVPFAFDSKPTNCEQNHIRFDSYTKYFKNKENSGEVLIAIARLGTGEFSRELNRSRLYIVRATLIEDLGLEEPEVVTAEGERVNGYGRVDIYVGGKLIDALLVNRGKALCGDCCHPEGRKYLYPNHKKQS